MRTKNTCRYYCAVVINYYMETTNFYKQKRIAIEAGEARFGKDNYIIIHWDFELPKKEGKK